MEENSLSRATKQVSATITVDTFMRVGYYSDNEDRTFSKMVEILLIEALDKRDKMPKSKVITKTKNHK
jgi:hypothetical protein